MMTVGRHHSVHQTSDFAVDPASPPITHSLPPNATTAGSVRAENPPTPARCQLIPSTELHTSVLVNCDPLLLASPPITQMRPSNTTASAASRGVNRFALCAAPISFQFRPSLDQ